MLLLLSLACAQPKTRVLLVQGAEMPPGASPVDGSAEVLDAWRTLVVGQPVSGTQSPLVLQAQMDDQGALEVPMRARSWEHAPFWTQAESAAILFVPTTWPVQEAGPGVKVLAPAPDLRGTPGQPTVLGLKSRATAGASYLRLLKDGDRYLGQIVGPTLPGAGIAGKDLSMQVERQSRALVVDWEGSPLTLSTQDGAQWASVRFPLGEQLHAQGWVRLQALEAFNQARLLISAIHVDPTQPWTQLSWPPEFGAELAATHGPFPTAQQPFPVGAVGEYGVDCERLSVELSELATQQARIAAAREERLVVLGSIAPTAWHQSGCHGGPAETAVEDTLAVLRGAMKRRDRLVVVGVEPHWVLGLDVQSLDQVGPALLNPPE
ncbi:MAG: hypothetical protein VX899_03170 [Myxococcota bacterium]|nr:hypothetical protein [Myxococcota bacterium]